MLNRADSLALKRQQLAGMEKRQLVEILAALWVSVETMTLDENSPPAASARTSSAQVTISHAWRKILRRLSSFKHFRASDVVRISHELAKAGEINRTQSAGSARAQLCHLVKKGFLKRRGGGNYEVTELAKSALKEPIHQKL